MADPLEAAPAPGAAAARAEAAARLARLGEEFFEVVHTTDPFNATQLGRARLRRAGAGPQPGRARRAARRGSRRSSGGWATSTRTCSATPAAPTTPSWRTSPGRARRSRARPLGGERIGGGLRLPAGHGLPVGPDRAARRRRRGRRLPAAAARRWAATSTPSPAATARPRRDGRLPTEVGVRQAIAQLTGHLGKDIGADTLVTVSLPADVDQDGGPRRGRPHRRGRGPARDAAAAGLPARGPAAGRPAGRAGRASGSCPAARTGYLAAVRRHTTTDLPPEEIHQIGLDVPRRSAGEWAELGGRVLGTSDVPAILARLRDGPRRCGSATPRRSCARSPTRCSARRMPGTTGSRRTTSPTA